VDNPEVVNGLYGEVFFIKTSTVLVLGIAMLCTYSKLVNIIFYEYIGMLDIMKVYQKTVLISD
jgi:hypothetical protein